MKRNSFMMFLRGGGFGRMAFLLGLLLINGHANLASATEPAPKHSGITWQPWSDSIFNQAAHEHKFVLLDLQAVWCHWCHVMDKTTYGDPKVIALIQSHYIAVRVDQDSRPILPRAIRITAGLPPWSSIPTAARL